MHRAPKHATLDETGASRNRPRLPLWQRLLRWLVPTPRPELAPEQRRRVWLVAALASAGGPFTGLLFLLLVVVRGDFSSWPPIIAIAGFGVAWVLSHRARDVAASWVLCWSAFLGPMVGSLLNPIEELSFQLYSLYLPAFLASVLLSPWAAIALVVAAEAALWAAWSFAPGLDAVQVESAMVFGLGVAPVTALSAVLVNRDLAQLHAQAQALMAARDEAVATSQGKSRFLARAGHELRTPLTGAIGYTDLLVESLKANGDDERVEDAQRARRSLDLLRNLVEEVMMLARIDLGRLPLKVGPVDCVSLARDCVDVVRLEAEEAGDAVTVVADEEPLVIESDAQKLSQVVLNLLTNAVRATRDGTIIVRVRRDPGRAGGVLLSVEDTGVGMDAEELARVFEEFWQGERQSGARGAGLGLTISRQLCGLLGAELLAESEAGRGSVFRLRLPAKAAGAVGG